MEIYFDRENLLSFIKSVHDDRFNDCNRMLKRQKNKITINCLKEKLMESPEAGNWIRTMTDGLQSSIVFTDSLFPERPIKSNSYISFRMNHFSALYLIDDIDSNKIIQRGCILLDNVGKEVESLSTLYYDDYQFTKNIEVKELNNWGFLRQYAMPLTDIIIVDQFCLSSPELIESNLVQLLKELSSKVKETKINIVVFTAKESYYSNDAISQIKRELKKSIGCAPNVTIVLSSKQNLKEHDRSIVTNYQALDSGDTYNYFNSKNDLITKGRYLHIKSKANFDNEKSSTSLLTDMQALINSINNEDLLIGDKQSNFLSFKMNESI